MINELGQDFLDSITDFLVYISCIHVLWIQRLWKSQSGSGSGSKDLMNHNPESRPKKLQISNEWIE